MQFDNKAQVFFSAKSENESFARLFAAGFLTQLDPTISEMTDIKTAVSEAVTNAIIHGYETREGMVELFCGYVGRHIYIEVADKGKGIENVAQAREPLYTSKPEMERSGMGFTIMETFMERVRVESRVGEGTRIFMEKTLAKE
ncbi:anti-sigma F factor [Anaerotignum sp.]|nr:anti-sigma F factor [Anaerotignum sp.]MBQ7757605.1 anti-sigma F factor [Anaerotignum sp.]